MWGPGHTFALALVVVVGHALHAPRPRSTVVLVAFWRRGRASARGAGRGFEPFAAATYQSSLFTVPSGRG